MEETFVKVAVASWKLIISRLDKRLASLDDSQLEKQIAPSKNRLFYLLGHLTAIHDQMLPLLYGGERLYSELDEVYIRNPDRSLADPLSAADLRRAWNEVNGAIATAIDQFSVEDWLKKHASVSDEDFIKEPTRNRLAILLNRTNHASYHAGQAALAR